jgi:deoxyribose-phosphate aldolase
MTPEHRSQIAVRALPLLDLTNLNGDCSREDIDTLCKRADTPHGTVGAICIWPRYVAHAHARLINTNIPIATVVNFPSGNQDIDITLVETEQAIDDGAAEIDLVMPHRAFAEGDVDAAREMMEAVRATCGERAKLKVIIESGELKSADLIREASLMAIDAGADFIKTSTGKVEVNATPETAELMIQAIADTSVPGGKAVGFKPAGGIKTVADAAAYLAIADRIMGAEWASPETLRFGASSLLDDLLSALEGGGEVVGEGY